MNKEQRKQAIEKVRELYYNYDYRLAKLQREIKSYEKALEHNLKEQKELNRLDIDPEEGFSISYEEKVQTSSNGDGVALKAIEKYISKLQQHEIYLRDSITERKNEISNIEIEYGTMKWNIDNLDIGHKKVIEIMCRDKDKSMAYLINSMFCGVPNTAYKHLDDALNNVLEFDNNWRG